MRQHTIRSRARCRVCAGDAPASQSHHRGEFPPFPQYVIGERMSARRHSLVSYPRSNHTLPLSPPVFAVRACKQLKAQGIAGRVYGTYGKIRENRWGLPSPSFSYQGETKGLGAKSLYQGEAKELGTPFAKFAQGKKELGESWVWMNGWGAANGQKGRVPQTYGTG